MKIALFKSLSTDDTIPVIAREDGTCWCEQHKDYVRLSESECVEFVMLENIDSVVKDAALEHARIAATKANSLVASLEEA